MVENKNAPRTAEQQASNEAAKKPTRDDVHEQRQQEQSQEGVVKQGARPPAQSQIDAERGDWEGMGQSQHRPPDTAAQPTPGANSLAGKKR
jgi:hypothetical protein